MGSKDHTLSTFTKFDAMVSCIFNPRYIVSRVMVLVNLKPMDRFLQSQDVDYRLTCPHSFEQNGILKCFHKIVVDTGFIMQCSH